MSKFKSRKLWATVIAGALTAFGEGLGIDPEAAAWLVKLVMAYVVGQGIADHGKV